MHDRTGAARLRPARSSHGDDRSPAPACAPRRRSAAARPRREHPRPGPLAALAGSGSAPPLVVFLPDAAPADGVDGADDALGHELCSRVGAVVLCIPWAPRRPGALDRAEAALMWAADHGEELGADPGRLVVAGRGAGAAAAAALALRARDRGWPPIRRQVLILADAGHRPASHDAASAPAVAGAPAPAILVDPAPSERPLRGVAARDRRRRRGAALHRYAGGIRADRSRRAAARRSRQRAARGAGGAMTERLLIEAARARGRSGVPRARGPASRAAPRALPPHARVRPRRGGRDAGRDAARVACAARRSRAGPRSVRGCTGSRPIPA